MADGGGMAKLAPGTVRWTEDVLALIQKRLDEGASARAIGKEIGASRNAVIGVCHRRGLRMTPPTRSERAKPSKPAKIVDLGPSAVYEVTRVLFETGSPPLDADEPVEEIYGKAEPLPPEPEAPRATVGVHVFDLAARHCRWPLWRSDRKPVLSEIVHCGADRLDGSPYCRGHAHIAHPSLAEKERAKAEAMERRLAAGRMTPGGTVRK